MRDEIPPGTLHMLILKTLARAGELRFRRTIARRPELKTIRWSTSTTPGYFETMQTPLLRGRDFSDRDDLHAPKAMVLSETTARHFGAPRILSAKPFL
jgi:hypothetical protein